MNLLHLFFMWYLMIALLHIGYFLTLMRYRFIAFTTDNIIGMLITSFIFPLWWFKMLMDYLKK